MFEYIKPMLSEAEEFAAAGDKGGMYRALRKMPFEQFNEFLITLPRDDYPAISAIAPRMASAEVQNGWTGTNGRALLVQSLAFVKSVVAGYSLNSSKPLSKANILDFGCGYGRLIRPFYYHRDADGIYGCDAWEVSLQHSRDAGIDCHLALSDTYPEKLPFDGVRFDLAYTFSIFTHLSERSTRTCLKAMADSLAPGGVMVVTIRPIEYWDNNPDYAEIAADKRREHDETGFAYVPHLRDEEDGEVAYGDTSMSLDYLLAAVPDLKLVGLEHSYLDPWQIIVFLQKPATGLKALLGRLL